MIFRNLGFVALVASALALGGCSTVSNPGAPDQSFDIDQDLQELEAEFKKGPTIKDFYANPTVNGRDEFISQRLTLMNIQYIKFIRRFAVEKAQLDTAADILIIGVNLAGTLVGAASTKGILAAISGGTAASRISINKNFFHEKTVPVLVTAMNAQRKEALFPIVQGVGESLEEYPFAQALSDLHIYYQAGTFIGALQAIQKDAGVKEGKADDKLAELREAVFGEDTSGKIIRSFVRPPDGKASDPVNQTNLDRVRDWIDNETPFEGLAIANYLSDPRLKALRERAIREIPIP